MPSIQMYSALNVTDAILYGFYAAAGGLGHRLRRWRDRGPVAAAVMVGSLATRDFPAVARL
ncbi:hypothetical protein GCM10018773_06260 [Streptomyces candidus]|nr:hypothetical protein GCM10018773_06260 [Streptomyces candidus]